MFLLVTGGALPASHHTTNGPCQDRHRLARNWARRSPVACVVVPMEMIETHGEQSGWFDWLQHEKSLVPERAEDLVVTSVAVLQLNGRFLYLKRTADLADFTADEKRILDALTRQGDTVFVAVGPDPGNLRLSYRMPALESPILLDSDGLRA